MKRRATIARQLAFAGLGLAWLISEAINSYGHGGGPTSWGILSARQYGIRPELLLATVGYVLVIVLDLLYFLLAATWLRKRYADAATRLPGKVALFGLWCRAGILLLSYVAVFMATRARFLLKS